MVFSCFGCFLSGICYSMCVIELFQCFGIYLAKDIFFFMLTTYNESISLMRRSHWISKQNSLTSRLPTLVNIELK